MPHRFRFEATTTFRARLYLAKYIRILASFICPTAGASWIFIIFARADISCRYDIWEKRVSKGVSASRGNVSMKHARFFNYATTLRAVRARDGEISFPHKK